MSIHDDVEIMGHLFHGLKEIESAVELSGSISGIRYDVSNRRNPEVVVPGIHIAEVWESYPCFDSEDRMYENRRYQNYFFSNVPFTVSTLRKILSRCRSGCNYQYVNSDMPVEFAPAVYYVGDFGKMVLATDD